VRTLRFLGLSPLNVRGLTILDMCVRLELELDLKLEIEIAVVGLRVGGRLSKNYIRLKVLHYHPVLVFMSCFLIC
jgi:hypothetical protein